MEFKGTKGKWIVDKSEGLNGRQLILVTNEEFDNNLKDFRIWFSNIDEESKVIDKANALLISKAPEMLEFLIELYKDIETRSGMFPSQQLKLEQLIKEATEL